MSRLEEVESEIANLDDSYSARTYTDGYADLARTLAAEVDARDAVITKLLDFIKKTCTVEYNMNGGVIRGSRTYARACQIAGRTE